MRLAHWPRLAGIVLAALCVCTSTLASSADHEFALPGGASVTLYAPLDGAMRPPLVAFVDASFWGLRPEQAPPVANMVVRPLRLEGVAVALLRHRPAPADEPSAYAQDVAAGLARLLEDPAALDFDPARVVLVGHGSGGQLAALVALDPRYLAAHDLTPSVLSAVVPISALYDLDGGDEVPDELVAYAKRAYPSRSARRDAAPLRHLRADAPPIVAVAATADVPGLARGAADFTAALRELGHPRAETFVAPGRDHYSVLALGEPGNTTRDHVMSLAGVGPRATQMAELLRARTTWRAPPLTTAGFWEHEDLIEAHEPTPEIDSWVRRFFGSGGGSSVGGVKQTWHAIALDAWLERLGAERTGTGRWLVLTNARGERGVLDLDAIRAYTPQVVVGIGAERNLFKVVDLYHTLRRYTWKQPEEDRWLLARPLGAFLYFEKAPPAGLVSGVFGLFTLTADSFARVAEDPLAPVRASAGPALENLLIAEKDCVSCHAFAGSGGRAGHLSAGEASLVAGFALPLEEYPAEVWRRYVYDQLDVASEIGASAVVLSPEQQELLFNGVVRSRAQR